MTSKEKKENKKNTELKNEIEEDFEFSEVEYADE